MAKLFVVIYALLTTMIFTHNASPVSVRKYFFTTDQLIRDAGYPCEERFAVTSDGYILRLFRIPPKSNSSAVPVLLAHGMSAASDYWVIQGPKKDLAFILNDSGYDVWLGNFRGDFYSRNHTRLNPDKPRFWKFSIDELGKYDIPTMIDTILKETGHKQLAVVGHSLGATAFLISMTSWPQYNSKIGVFVGMSSTALTDPRNRSYGQKVFANLWRRMVLMAIRVTAFFISMTSWPQYNSKVGVFVGMSPTALSDRRNRTYEQKVLFNLVRRTVKQFYDTRVLELGPRDRFGFTPLLAHTLCSRNSWFQDYCFDLGNHWAGKGEKLTARKTFDVLLGHVPSGFSILMAVQYLQNLSEGKFRPLNWGTKKNLEIYGHPEPPDYNLTVVTCPVAFYYSNNDFISSPADAELTLSKMPNVVRRKNVKGYTHIDFVLSRFAWRDVYADILDLFNSTQFNPIHENSDNNAEKE